jgi:tetratricopeptide (TPR) repeat protein
VQTADRNRNRLLSALAAADRALAIDPEFPEAHHARGTILDRLGRPAEAVAAYTRAAELLRTISGRDDPELLKAIGLVYWNERDYAGAKLWFRRAAAATDDRIARLATTLVSAIDGNRMQAVGDLRALVEEDPDLGEAWNALGFLLLGNRVGELGTAGGGENPDPRGAEQAYGEAVRCRPADPDPRIGRAQARLDRVRRGDGGTDLIAAARHDLEIAAAIAPEDRDARSAALQTALATGDWQGAIPHAEALARIAPRDPQGVLFRAWALSHAGRVKEVLPDLQAVLAEPIGNPTLEAQLTRLRDEIAAGKVVDRSPRLAPRVTPAAGP